jgi:sugar/nucleoside kinase (ribokinase family)
MTGMTSSYDAVVIGAFGVSTAVTLPADGRGHGVEMTFTDVRDSIGHAGGDSALGFAALGGRTAAVGHVGDDPPGDWVRAELARAGIDTSALDADPAGTARSVSLVAPDGGRSGYYDGRGHLTAVAPADGAATVAAARLALFHLANWSRQLLPTARRAGVTVAVDLQDLLDPDDPYRRDYVEQADILFFSAVNVPDPGATITALLGDRTDRVVVAGLGARGCAVGTGDGIRLHPPVQLDLPVVDTNGAGDALAVGFLTSYVLDGRPLDEAAHRGQVAARWVCGQRSSSFPLITAAELDRLSSAAARR